MVCLDYFGTGEFHLPGIHQIFRGSILSREWRRRAGALRPPWPLAWGWEAQRHILTPAAPGRSSGRAREKCRAGKGVRAGPEPGVSRGSLLEVFPAHALRAFSLLLPPLLSQHPRAPRPLGLIVEARHLRTPGSYRLPRADGAAACLARRPKSRRGRCRQVRRRLRPHHGRQLHPSTSPGRN